MNSIGKDKATKSKVLPHYLEALAWSSTDDDGNTIDHLSFTKEANGKSLGY